VNQLQERSARERRIMSFPSVSEMKLAFIPWLYHLKSASFLWLKMSQWATHAQYQPCRDSKSTLSPVTHTHTELQRYSSVFYSAG
jgi:hypothetical protein